MRTEPLLVIDARMVGPVPHGIAQYVTRLSSGLSRLRQFKSSLGYRPVFLVSSEFPKNEFGDWGVLRSKAEFLATSELLEIPSVLRRNGATLYHSPSFSSLFAYGPFKAPCPWIVTIHDLNHLSYGGFSKKIYYRSLLRPFARAAAALATVSEFSRHEISEWVGIPVSEIEVVYNALPPGLPETPDETQSASVLRRFGVESKRYFFCLSNPKPHKNIPFLVESFSEYRKNRGPNGQAWPLLLSMDGFEGIEGVKSLGALADAEVRILRAHAGAVVFPSLYEGFGLPPVEAAVSGVPLIVSKIPPHEEGLSDLRSEEATWIDPNDRRSLTEALTRAGRGELQAASVDSRRRVQSRFSEDTLATHMDRIYRRVLGLSS